jgi:hypothetical protein
VEEMNEPGRREKNKDLYGLGSWSYSGKAAQHETHRIVGVADTLEDTSGTSGKHILILAKLR